MLMVVAFHAGLPLSGGFIGVDVFFVISGYVITSSLLREWDSEGRLRLASFYFRRFSRLAPALSAMVAVTMILAGIALSPLGAQQIAAQTGTGTMLLGANLVIAHITGNYFDAPAESNPLLHAWSLSVEEQLYLFFPAIISAGLGAARRWGRPFAPHLIIGTVALLSFLVTSLYPVGTSARGWGWTLGFYGPVARAWEFAVGATLAFVLPATPIGSRRRLARALAFLGAGVLVLATVRMDSRATFPSDWLALAVVGSAMLLAAGAMGPNPISQALGAPAFVAVGDLSYSIYLWHWPLIVVATAIWPLTPVAPAFAALASVAPAWASYRWIEVPFRSRPPARWADRARSIAVVALTPLLLAGALGLTATRYWLPRFESGAIPAAHQGDMDWTDFYSYLRQRYYPCENARIREIALRWESITRCRQTLSRAEVDVALVGDSHVEALFLGLAEALPGTNIAFYILDAAPIDDEGPMSLVIDEVARDPSIKSVVVNAYWAARTFSGADLAKTLRSFTEAGKQVFLADDVPTYPFDASACAFSKAPLIPVTECEQERVRFDSVYASYFRELIEAADAVRGVTLIRTARYLCDEDVCSMTLNGRLLYRDGNHLNNAGSRYVVSRLLHDAPELVEALSVR